MCSLRIAIGMSGQRPSSGGSIPWTPQDIIADLDMWHDADDATTFTLSGAAVTEWRDKSGNLRHAPQATAIDRPDRTDATQNGKAAVTFVAADTELLGLTGTTPTAGAKSVFAVFKMDGGASPTLSSIKLSDNTYIDIIGNLYGGIAFMKTDAPGVSAQAVGVRTGTFTTAPVIFSMRYNGGTITDAASYACGIDGTDETIIANKGIFNKSGSSLPALGGRYEPAINRVLNGFIAEHIVYDGVPTDAIRYQIEGYLAHKWGLQGNLPVSHPYKDQAPNSNF